MIIKEPAEVDFTTISIAWTAEEEKEFSEFIKKQKEVRFCRVRDNSVSFNDL
jgi:hypothetical protein